MKDLKDYIIESLIYHSGIELNESYGEFEENHAVSSFIANKIDKLYKNGVHKKDFTVYPKQIKDASAYFDELNVHYEVGDEYASGYVYKTDIEIDIYIVIPNDYKIGELQKKIAHEFQHYLEDMILIGKGLKTFEEIFDKDSQYGILYNNARNFKDHTVPQPVRDIRKALYILDKFEQHAFIATLCEEINQLKDKNRSIAKKLSPNEMWDIIKQTDEYKAFISLSEVLSTYKETGFTRNEEIIIKKEWRKMTGKDEQNIGTIIDSLLSKLKKAIKKLNETLPKKICEMLEPSCFSI